MLVMDDQLDKFDVVDEILVFLVANAVPDKPKDKRYSKADVREDKETSVKRNGVIFFGHFLRIWTGGP